MKVTRDFLSEVANAADLTDVNIAAGAALQRLEQRDARARARRVQSVLALAAVTMVASMGLGDAFAASPIQLGLDPLPNAHVFTSLGFPSWQEKRAAVFGERLPWNEHDGWLVRETEELVG